MGRRRSQFDTGDRYPQLRWLLPLGVGLVVVWLLPHWIEQRRLIRAREVVVYAAQDQVYAEPILHAFEHQSGIRVRAVYDNEAVKSVGLANRLLAERGVARCDVFWGNEELRTRQLEARGVWREQQPWVAVGYRSRRIIYNTEQLAPEKAPSSLMQLTNGEWRGKLALAYPLFGTTATHFLALRSHWGTARWENWCRALQANDPLLVDGNSVVVRLVGMGEAWVGLTDSDDIAAGYRQGYPVASMPISAETLLIPNTIAVVRNAPHPVEAEMLLKYLRSRPVVQRLIQLNALEGVDITAQATSVLRPDWGSILRTLEYDTTTLKRIFAR